MSQQVVPLALLFNFSPCESCWDSDKTQNTVQWWNTVKVPGVRLQ